MSLGFKINMRVDNNHNHEYAITSILWCNLTLFSVHLQLHSNNIAMAYQIMEHAITEQSLFVFES